MENVSRFKEMRKSEQQVSTNSAMESQESTEEVEEPHETLSRALKRKFIELDEITQRLRLRLSNVTNDEAEFNDELADEFEHDINTLCVEDDYNLIDFEDGTGNKTNLAASKHVSPYSRYDLFIIFLFIIFSLTLTFSEQSDFNL